MPRLNTVQLKATFDQSLSDSDNIEGFTATGGDPQTLNIPGIGDVFIYVDGEPLYSEGQERIDPNAGVSYVGFEQVRYNTPQMHIDSLEWLIDNYRGQVTANIRKRGTPYARFNCQLRFENQESQRKNYPQVTWIFTIIEAL